VTIESAEEFVRLVTSGSAAERKRAAWADAPEAVWREVIEKAEMRFWVAHNRTVPVEVLRVLATDEDWRVRDRIASRRACPPEILTLLSKDGHEAVLSTIAGHPHTPTAVLERLANHPWSQITEKALRQLSQRNEAQSNS
jgi:hypothetical protein